jgi:hypothetical protein
MSLLTRFRGHWRAILCFAVLASMFASSCARDVNKGENQEEPFPVQIDFSMTLGEDPSTPGSQYSWYYMVFNFGNLNPSATTKPLDQLVGTDRGKNWDMYVGFHVDPATGEIRTITDRRQRGPTTLPTADGPVDACIGNFNPKTDPATDILVACRDGNAVQLYLAETKNIADDIFYPPTPTTVNTGTAPMRIFSSAPTMGSFPANFNFVTSVQPYDADGDDDQDAVVILAGATSGTIRPLLSNGDGQFSTGTEVTVPGIPVDAIFAELDTPGVAGVPDLAILTVDTPGGAGTVRIFTGAAGNTFTAGPTFPVGDDPVQIAGGFLDEGNDVDIAVANAGSDDVNVFLGGPDATFTSETTLTSPGELRGVAINTIFGTGGDVVISYDEAGTGNVGVFMREGAGPPAVEPLSRDIEHDAGLLVSFDAGADLRPDVFNLETASGTTAGNLVISRAQSVTPTGGGAQEFAWAESPIVYPTGDGPARMVPVDIDGDNDLDLIIPDAGTGDNGNNIAVYIDLGRYQFADVNIYWTDAQRWNPDLPPDLTLQPWYVSHSIAGNRIEMTVDATQFLSLAEIPPEELLRGETNRNYFTVDFMTADASIDFVNKAIDGINLDTGIVTEHFTNPVIVPMTIGFLDNNATHAIVELPVSPAQRNIVDWQIEAN